MIIVAEFCSNISFHNWNFRKFCKAASGAGATHAKIQIYSFNHFPKDEWPEKAQTQFPRHKIKEYADIAHSYGLLAGASVFDIAAVFISKKHLDFIKLGAREENNFALLSEAHHTGLPIIRSVDFRNKEGFPRLFNETLMACIPEYPTEGFAINLPTGIEKLPKPFGWSSHTRSSDDVVTAVRRGATVIEKHLCLTDKDPEAAWSLDPAEFKSMVERIHKAVEQRGGYF